MVYKIVYTANTKEDLRRLPLTISRRIVEKIETYLVRNPQGLGKPLTGEFRGFWRYRIGDYRIVYRIISNQVMIVILRIDHRKNVYHKVILN